MEKRCSNCGTKVHASAAFCPQCGSSQFATSPDQNDSVFCSKCGKQISSETKFCPYCGNPNALSANAPGKAVAQGIMNQFAAKMTKSKWIILLLSSISFLFLFILPYVTVYVKKNNYPIWLIVGNDYPRAIDGDYDAVFSTIMFFLIACIITIIVSMIMEKKKVCLIASLANVVISFTGFLLVMNMVQSTESKKVTCTPIGSLLNLGLGIAVLILILKEKKKTKKTTAAFAYR